MISYLIFLHIHLKHNLHQIVKNNEKIAGERESNYSPSTIICIMNLERICDARGKESWLQTKRILKMHYLIKNPILVVASSDCSLI